MTKTCLDAGLYVTCSVCEKEHPRYGQDFVSLRGHVTVGLPTIKNEKLFDGATNLCKSLWCINEFMCSIMKKEK